MTSRKSVDKVLSNSMHSHQIEVMSGEKCLVLD